MSTPKYLAYLCTRARTEGSVDIFSINIEKYISKNIEKISYRAGLYPIFKFTDNFCTNAINKKENYYYSIATYRGNEFNTYFKKSNWQNRNY